MSVPATHVAGFDALHTQGAYYFGDGHRTIIFICPCGCGQVLNLPIKPVGSSGPGWEWNGHEEQPTLTPSIARQDGCHWHGFLTNGEWVTV
jgi:hypothetical protein